MNDEEIHIITRILAGKTEEYAYFLNAYSQQIHTLIIRMGHSPEDAEELVQDTFIKAFRNLSSFRGKSSFMTWLYRIAYNLSISALRKRKSETINIDEQYWAKISDTETDEELDNDTEEQIKKLRHALTLLPPDERALIALFYEEAHSLRDISNITGITENNVKVKLHRIRKKICLLIKRRTKYDTER